MKHTRDKSIPNGFINAQYNGKNLIVDTYRERSIYYQDGAPYINDKGVDISNSIDRLREMNVFDYEEYSSVLYLSEDYENFLQISSDTNIAEITKKQSNITTLLLNIKERKKQLQDFFNEENAIIKNLINIGKILHKNLETINDNQLKYKGESNLQIKKDNLNVCKDELESLSHTVSFLDKFLLEKKGPLMLETDSEAIKYNINKLIDEIIAVRENLTTIFNELTKYLIRIEKEIEKIKHINKLYKLKQSGELFEKTNIEKVFNKVRKPIKNKRSAVLHYFDDEMVDAVVNKYEEKYNKKIEDEKIEKPISKKVKSVTQKKSQTRVTISAKDAYRRFLKQESDLGSFLGTLNIEEKKFISLYIRVISNYHSLLDINTKKRIVVQSYNIPYVMKRI